MGLFCCCAQQGLLKPSMPPSAAGLMIPCQMLPSSQPLTGDRFREGTCAILLGGARAFTEGREVFFIYFLNEHLPFLAGKAILGTRRENIFGACSAGVGGHILCACIFLTIYIVVEAFRTVLALVNMSFGEIRILLHS